MLKRNLIALLITAAMVMTGCGGSDNENDATGTVKVPFLVDESGLVSPYALQGLDGARLAVEEANASGELGDTKLELDVIDTASDPTRAVTHMQHVVDSDAPMAVYGLSSAEAVRMAPIAQQGEIPLVLWQSGGEGTVETGDYIYRTTPPQATLQNHTSTYFADKDVQRVAIIYNSDIPTLIDLAEHTYPQLAKEDGYEIVKSTGIPATATDMSTVTSQLISAQPDAVIVLLFGSQAVSVTKELKESNYGGILATQTGVGLATLKAMGDAADGMVFASDYLPVDGPPSAQKFVDAFRAKYNRDPDNFAWSGYDAARMVIEAVKKASDLSREGMQSSLQEVAEAGFDGAIGQVNFDDRDARTEGGLLQWSQGKLVRLDG